ncbi:MAG: hypothetical protein NT136_04100 [Candidatus Moranbacteria bacterium]|nr:hypothetical protein [Candidatus Moranbacteria bacterium]
MASKDKYFSVVKDVAGKYGISLSSDSESRIKSFYGSDVEGMVKSAIQELRDRAIETGVKFDEGDERYAEKEIRNRIK